MGVMFSEGFVKYRAFATTAFSGLLTASIFTFIITGTDYFSDFISSILVITFISALSALLVVKKSLIAQVVTGVSVAFACCVLVLIYAVSNI